jgi:hypothetical protein
MAQEAKNIRYYVGGRGKERGGGVWVGVRSEGERTHKALNPRNDLYNHSPDGFEYGYAGSGPAQLALALLADHLKYFPEDKALARRIARLESDVAEESSDRLAVLCHQAFKFTVIAPLKGDSWQMTSEEITSMLRMMAER